MKISKQTQEIISSIRAINAGSNVEGAVFKQGNVIKARRYKSSAPIMKAIIDETWPRDFAVYDIKKFISMFSILDDPEVEFKDDYIEFKSGKKKAKLKYVPPHLIENDQSFFEKDVKMPDPDFVANLTTDDFNSIKKAAAMFASPQIAFIGDGENVVLSTYNTLDPKSDKFDLAVGAHPNKFTAIIDLQYVQFLPRDYTVGLSFKGIVEFKSDNLVYYVTVSDKSKVEK